MSDGIVQTQEKATADTTYYVDPKLSTTEAFWWWVKRFYEGVDRSLLLQLELDREFQAGQVVCGSVLELVFEDEPDKLYYHLRARVPGPFPATLIHADDLGSLHLQDVEEAIVWILSHELCHFMKRTGQLLGENDEKSACDFADDWLIAFRRNRSKSPR